MNGALILNISEFNVTSIQIGIILKDSAGTKIMKTLILDFGHFEWIKTHNL